MRVFGVAYAGKGRSIYGVNLARTEYSMRALAYPSARVLAILSYLFE
jgi:hypothetical protein